MYTEHFGLSEKPFSLIPAADAVYFSPGHRAAFNMLEFGLHESVGITVITGEVGSGKTTLVRHLLRRIDYQELTLGLISTTHRSFGSLLKWIVNSFRLEVPADDEGTLLQAIQDFLLKEYAEGKRTVVIIDEAQNADLGDLETLRLLTNINADGQQLLQIIVVGQPELLDKFQDPRMSQLAQRVSAEYNLGPLSALETMSYVNYRLGQVGGKQEIFDTAALMAVYYYSGGLPRIVNTLCDGAMVFAYGQGLQAVNLETMLEVVKTKRIGGVHRPGLRTNPDREAVRADVQKIRGVDMLDLVGRATVAGSAKESVVQRGGDALLRDAAASRLGAAPGASLINGDSAKKLLLVAIGLACLGVAFSGGLKELWRLWMNNPAYSHGPMIPLVSAFLLWQAWPQIKQANWQGSWLAPVLMVFALVGWLAGELSALYIILHYSFVLALAALYFAVTGWAGLRRGWPALVYLAFMIPLPPFLYNNLSGKLQLISTELGVLGMRAAGVSVFVEGNVIDLGVYQLQVVEACSGLRYLFPLSSFGFLIAVIYRGPFWHRAVIFLSTLPITVLMNSFRIAVIGVTVEHFGIEAAEGFLHAFEGWFIFVACVLLLLGVIALLNRLPGGAPSMWQRLNLAYPTFHEMASVPAGERDGGRVVLATTLLCLLAVPVSYAIGERAEQVPPREQFSSFPLIKDEWIGREGRLEGNVLEALGLTDYIVADYRRGTDPVPVNLYTAFYNSQRTEAKIHSPRSCMPGGGWEIAELSQVNLSEVLGREAPDVNRVIIRLGNSEQLVYYWFQQRGRIITNEYLAKWYLLVDGLTLARSDGALVRIVTPVTEPAGTAAAEARIHDFIRSFYDELPAYIPGREAQG